MIKYLYNLELSVALAQGQLTLLCRMKLLGESEKEKSVQCSDMGQDKTVVWEYGPKLNSSGPQEYRVSLELQFLVQCQYKISRLKELTFN